MPLGLLFKIVGEQEQDQKLGKAERDIVALGIAAAAIILFVATGSSVLPRLVASVSGTGSAPDNLLVNAMLLNIALIIFGWRRYRDLTNEIAERRKAEETARKLAATDPLTDCLNRRSMEGATDALRQMSTARGQATAFVMIDLDNFKQVNDMNGHGMGDKVLTILAQRIRECLPKSAPLARLGGDEFAFAMPYSPDRPDKVDEMVASLFEVVSGKIEVEGSSIDTTMSIGIATDHDLKGKSAGIEDTETLMHHADIAMYQAKKNGKNRYFWFEPTMENELRFRNELEKGIRRGLKNREFVPFYEQQVDITSGELVGFEMLARWKSPDLGVVNPEVFIPIAEEIGVIAEMSEQLMIQAFADAQSWDPALTLSVNISPIQMRDPWFSQRLLKLLVEHNFPANRLEIEVTETCLHENLGLVKTMIASLRNQGVKVSLDDFGTGYSSLSQLRTLPFDRIKIDRSFVKELRNKEGSKIINAIISLGDGLQMPITAEGIENAAILEQLRDMGDLKGQGYHYGRPEDANQVLERLSECGRLATNTRSSPPASDNPDSIADLPAAKRQA
ncbi:MAG: EAL domain-containing protein [Altererythrobacter ishigakiensis]|nr:EAL domain-containing protein [Altererythrobacter ishigakiensis]